MPKSPRPERPPRVDLEPSQRRTEGPSSPVEKCLPVVPEGVEKATKKTVFCSQEEPYKTRERRLLEARPRPRLLQTKWLGQVRVGVAVPVGRVHVGLVPRRLQLWPHPRLEEVSLPQKLDEGRPPPGRRRAYPGPVLCVKEGWHNKPPKGEVLLPGQVHERRDTAVGLRRDPVVAALRTYVPDTPEV